MSSVIQSVRWKMFYSVKSLMNFIDEWEIVAFYETKFYYSFFKLSTSWDIFFRIIEKKIFSKKNAPAGLSNILKVDCRWDIFKLFTSYKCNIRMQKDHKWGKNEKIWKKINFSRTLASFNITIFWFLV